ncbi:MAG: putative Ig domain-containing protein, partial [Candidatus Omnitrophica bacterium]|nr:putative Ig domain-containing protein [Candidatus Omnitrophota bacterium]
MKVRTVIFLTAIFLITAAGISAAAVYTANYAPKANTLTPSRGSARTAMPVNFTSSYADNNGYSDIKTAICQINTSTNRKKAFCGYYNRAANRLYLYNDAGTGFVPGSGVPGSNIILENSYVKLDCSRTRVIASGKVLVVNWNVTFKAPAASSMTKRTYLYAVDSKNAATGWVQKGTWKVQAQITPPAADFTADPASGDTPLTVQFTDKTTGPVTSRSWDFGDGAKSAAANPVHTYSLVSPWDVDYQADDLPQDTGPEWTQHVHGTPETETIEAGVLHNKCDYSAGQSVYYSKPADFISASLYTIEARMRLASFAGISYGAMCLGAYDDNYAWRLDITPNNINLGWSAEYKAIYEMDTTSDFHTYRVKVLNGVVNVYVDGVKRIAADMKHTAGHGYPSSVYFGQIISGGTVSPYPPATPDYIEAFWDHIKIENTRSRPLSQSYYTVALTATGTGGSNTKTVTDCVNVIAPPPEIFTKGLPDGVVNERYSETLYVDNGVLPYTWSIVSGSVPSGLGINSRTGEITGWPSAAGTYDFIVEAKDYKGRTDTQTLSINVAPYPALTDFQLLWETEAKSAAYFYYEVLSNGFVKDSTMNCYCASVGATGFGLAALSAIANNSQVVNPNSPWTITGAQARERVVQILDNCIAYQNRQTSYGNEYGYGGFLPHFINADGTCFDNREVSTVDMAIFMAGAIVAGEYFGGEVKDKVETIYNKLEWRLFLNIYSKQFSHGWDTKTRSVISQTWDRPSDETILVSVMALGKEPDAEDFLE